MLKWPVIRHIRWLWLSVRFALWWRQMSVLFITPNPSDIKYLNDVWEGKE